MLTQSKKQQVYAIYLAALTQKINDLEKAVNDAQSSANSEEKSSMGDKYETGRAMSMQSRDLAAKQLLIAKSELNYLLKLNLENANKVVGQGSLVQTTKGNFFIAISLGQVVLNQENFMAISANAPIGKLLVGKIAQDEFTFNNKTYQIQSVI